MYSKKIFVLLRNRSISKVFLTLLRQNEPLPIRMKNESLTIRRLNESLFEYRNQTCVPELLTLDCNNDVGK